MFMKDNGPDTLKALEESVDVEVETQEELNSAYKRLSSLTRGDGQLVTMTKQELSLLQKMLSTGSEEFREQQMWRMCTFLDQEESLDHVAAYFEAKELGMDTGFNVAYVFALCSANRKGNFNNNLIAMLTETLQHGKWANAQRTNKNESGANPRSPLARQ